MKYNYVILYLYIIYYISQEINDIDKSKNIAVNLKINPGFLMVHSHVYNDMYNDNIPDSLLWNSPH